MGSGSLADVPHWNHFRQSGFGLPASVPMAVSGRRDLVKSVSCYLSGPRDCTKVLVEGHGELCNSFQIEDHHMMVTEITLLPECNIDLHLNAEVVQSEIAVLRHFSGPVGSELVTVWSTKLPLRCWHHP